MPLLKERKKYETDTKSYRGVNIIPSIAKIVDKVLLNQLLKHLEVNKLIPFQHYGGMPGHGTATALTTIIDSWTDLIEKGEDTVALIMDQSMAYDIVDHKIVIRKL